MGFHQEANVTHRSSSNGHHVSDGDDAATIATLLSEDHDPRVVDHQQQQVYYSVVASEEIEYVPSSSPSVLHQQDETFDSNSEKEFDDSPRDNSLRIVYGNFESSNFENQKLIHEHYYDHILTPQLKQRQRDLANFLLNYNYHQNIILKIFSLICWIFYNIIITFIVHFCLKNIIFYSISLIYRCCNCERYNFGSLSTTSVVNDDISSSSSITTDHFNTYSLHRIFQNRRDFEKYWKQATTWLWNFLFADNNESLQTISEGVTSRTLFSRDRNCNYPRFCDNTISNTKYKWYNFFWKSISEQFSLRMNQYFLALACLQFWKVASPTNPITTWIPLIVVVTVGVAKEFIDDYFRYKKDTEINLNKVTIVRSGSFHVIPSYQVQVGDIVYLQEEEQIRADMILLKSSNILKKEKISRVESGDDVDPTTNDFLCDISGGIAWIETSALDGESHYKERKAIPEVQKLFSNNVNEYGNILNNFSCIVECSLPNADLDHFRGDLLVADRMGGFTRYPLSYHNLLLQGTTLKSTSHALALVVYTGNETKIGMNKKEAEMKWTKMDNFINHVVVGIFMVQLVIGLSFGIIGNYYNILQSQHSPFYLALDQYPILSVTNASTNTLLLFRIVYNFIYPILPYLIIPLRFTMLCSLMIPQSLKITSDITKYIISMFFIAKDNGLSDNRGNMPSCSNTSVAEDLGQIQYIFTDKTGTITDNLLTLSRVIVDGQVIRVPKHTKCSTASTTHFLWTHNTASNDSIRMKFLRNLALCHTVYCENAENVYMPHYRSSSPEEDAFVKFAASQGVVLNYRDEERMVLKIYDNRDENSRDRSFVLEEYRILKVLYFTSDRRRMSIIVKQQEIDNIDSLTRYFIMCKGADDVLSERMDNKDPSLLQQTLSHIQTLASQEGLRVMLMAYRELSSDEVSTFMERISLADDSNEQSIFEEIETNFQLLGATAMEDKLQEGAAECIESLRDAGISIWMLTGDKMETAVQIAQTCHIIPSLPSDDLLLIYLRGSSVVTVRDALHQALTKLGNSSHLFACLIFEGKILNYILSDDDTNHHNQTAEIKSLENLILFLRLCEQVQACVCCRMTPKFKGKIVRMIKYPVTNIEASHNNNRLQSLSSPICLAIGDGGNDVNMILEADVGVGISSSVKPTGDDSTIISDQEIHTENENLQAVRAADFGIPRFSALKRLILVHGRNSYKRLALVSQYTMYKSVVLAACQLVYNLFFTYFSGSTILQSHSLVFYNILYTSLLPFAFSMGDISVGEFLQFLSPIKQTRNNTINHQQQHHGHSFEVSDMALEKIPELYKSSQKGETITKHSLVLWFLNAIYQGFTIIAIFSLSAGSFSQGCACFSKQYGDSSLGTAEEISKYGHFKSELEHLNSLVMFVLVTVQWITVKLIYNWNTVTRIYCAEKRKFSLISMILKLRFSNIIMGISVIAFLIINAMTFSGISSTRSIFSILLVFGNYSCLYLIALLTIVICILPSLFVMWGIRDGQLILLYQTLFHKKTHGIAYQTISAMDDDQNTSEIPPMTPSEYALLKFNISAFVRHEEEKFYQERDASRHRTTHASNENTIEPIATQDHSLSHDECHSNQAEDEFYHTLRNKVRFSMNLPLKTTQ